MRDVHLENKHQRPNSNLTLKSLRRDSSTPKKEKYWERPPCPQGPDFLQKVGLLWDWKDKQQRA